MASMREFNCFIFDFDGTLARSEPAYSKAFHHSVTLHTGLEISEDEFRGFWNATPAAVLGRYGPEMLDEMLVSFEEHYYANHHHHLVAYEGIVELLEVLDARGAGIGVVSLKPRRAGELELDITGLRRFMRSAVWGDDVLRPKPEPDGVLRAMSDMNAEPGGTLVIGDSPADIIMGRAAKTRTAAALWSGAGRDLLLAENPDFSLDSPSGLFDLLES
jgi:pyrophosphatase PpaX